MTYKPPETRKVEKLPHKHGDKWLNMVTGAEYKWDAIREMWIITGESPYGADPMGFFS